MRWTCLSVIHWKWDLLTHLTPLSHSFLIASYVTHLLLALQACFTWSSHNRWNHETDRKQKGRDQWSSAWKVSFFCFELQDEAWVGGFPEIERAVEETWWMKMWTIDLHSQQILIASSTELATAPERLWLTGLKTVARLVKNNLWLCI